MKFAPRRLQGTFEITLEPRGDPRGHFVRWYDRQLFANANLPTEWVQGNESLSRRNVVRGLHFQRGPHAETKLVRAVAGSVLDVFVDVRRASPTFGHWDALELSAAKRNAVLVPRGFAHGFCVLSEEAIVTYLVDSAYEPAAEAGLLWNDPALAIPWPVAADAIVSDKDRGWPRLDALEPA